MSEKEKFPLGHISTSRGAAERLTLEEQISLITRHSRLDQGELDDYDYKMNKLGIENGDRIISCYMVRDERVYVETSADRSLTTVYLFGEY